MKCEELEGRLWRRIGDGNLATVPAALRASRAERRLTLKTEATTFTWNCSTVDLIASASASCCCCCSGWLACGLVASLFFSFGLLCSIRIGELVLWATVCGRPPVCSSAGDWPETVWLDIGRPKLATFPQAVSLCCCSNSCSSLARSSRQCFAFGDFRKMPTVEGPFR